MTANGNNNNTTTLRHRKQQGTTHNNNRRQEQQTTATTTEDDVGQQQQQQQQQQQLLSRDEELDDDEHDHAHFSVTPLIERSPWMRLDVWPFALLYIGLVWAENHTVITEEGSALLSSVFGDDNHVGKMMVLWGLCSLPTLLFVMTLVCHLCVVLWTQWSVSAKAKVGFYSYKKQQENAMKKNNDHSYKHWTHCLIQSAHKEMDGSFLAGIVPVRRPDHATTTNNNSSSVVVITFQDRVFRYSPSSYPDLDESLWVLKTETQLQSPSHTGCRFRPVQYPSHYPMRFYANWTGHEDVTSCVSASRVYGANTTALQLPKFTELLLEQTVAPFFLFQIFCVVLWSLDEYWYYALFTLFALLMFESTVAYNRLRSLQRLHDISQKHQKERVWVRRGAGGGSKRQMAWMYIPVREVVPGDWIGLSVNAHPALPVPADVVLMHGTAVCDEALLTGESVPQLKQPLDTTSLDATLDMQTHKESILFGGTVLLAGTPDETSNDCPEKGVVTGIVLRTGFETAQGNLLRTMAHSSKNADGVHTADTFVFILLLIICAIGAASLVLQDGWNDERRNRFRLVLHVIIIITSVVPPELPMELSLAVTNSVNDLMRRCHVFCTEHFRIPWAGEVNVCCFDKTGTLTSDEMRLKGVRLVDNDSTADDDHESDSKLVHPTEGDLPWPVLRVMAACHSLAIAAVGQRGSSQGRSTELQVIGDPLEQTVLLHTGFRLMGNSVVSPTEQSQLDSGLQPISILHRFAFSSKLKRMTVLATEEGGKGILWALTKGAPETVKAFLRKDSLPANYDSISLYHMSRGRRVLAMAYREVGRVQKLQTIKDNGREPVERDLLFAGFLILDCPLKPDSKSVISELKKSRHDVVMITGDAILTAADVARQVGIIRRAPAGKRTSYRIQKRSNTTTKKSSIDPLSLFECVPLGATQAMKEETLKLSLSKLGGLMQMKKQGDASFCLSGDTLLDLATTAMQVDKPSSRLSPQKNTMDEKHLLLSPIAQDTLKKLVPLVSVFARHAPHQKEAVVAAFNHGGYQTLMCGDGTNDVGALKRSHVGISIISAPEIESKQRSATAKISKAKADGKKDGKTKKKKGKARAHSVEESLRLLHEAQEELGQVELGDASVAAPFTSRAVSIRCCKDVIQQGRCTLVTMLQIYKILGINCLVNALVLSKLFLHGVKQGDRQLTILGLVVAALFFFVTRAEPLPDLSPIRPPSSVLCLQAIVSITGQFLIHLGTILLVTESALAFVDPFDPSLVPDGPFNPNVLNTCTFLVTCQATVNTFACNYRGRPFMKDLRENKMFYRSLQGCYAVLAICALEIFPPLNDLLQLTTLPSVHEQQIDDSTANGGPILLAPLIEMVDFPIFVTGLLALDTILSFAFERFILKTFESR